MSGFPTPRFLPDGLITISTLGPMSIGSMAIRGGVINAGTAWPSANLALYIPFRIASPFQFSSIAVAIGSTGGNLDMGVYSADGTKIISTGSTAVVSNVNTISVSTTTIGPGLFYLAMACSSIGCYPMAYSLSSTAKASILRMLGISQQATALPLPATATFAANTGYMVPIMGITGRSFI
jgi:hypothetical protein